MQKQTNIILETYSYFLRMNLQLNTEAEHFERTEADAEELGVAFRQIVMGM